MSYLGKNQFARYSTQAYFERQTAHILDFLKTPKAISDLAEEMQWGRYTASKWLEHATQHGAVVCTGPSRIPAGQKGRGPLMFIAAVEEPSVYKLNLSDKEQAQ